MIPNNANPERVNLLEKYSHALKGIKKRIFLRAISNNSSSLMPVFFMASPKTFI